MEPMVETMIADQGKTPNNHVFGINVLKPFLDSLGISPDTLQKVDIHFETGRFAYIDLTCAPVMSDESVGLLLEQLKSNPILRVIVPGENK